MRKTIKNIVIGMFFIIIGVAVLGDAIGFWNFRLFHGWWTLFIIFPAIVSIISDGIKFINSIALTIGIILLLSDIGFFERINVWLLCVGAGLVVFGVRYLFGWKNTLKDKNE